MALFKKNKNQHDTYKELQELEDPLVCEDIKCIPTDGVDNGQAVNLVLD